MPRRIFITAAEVSGDLHASHLIQSLRALDPALVIEAHGGPRMAAAGATIHVETTRKAAMGLGGVLRVAEMYKLLRWTRKKYRDDPPDLHICVDSPSLNFNFAKIAKAAGRPVLMYVAPQLWAWREGRMKKLRKLVDRLACILPFEEAYFRAHGVNATFVGHPLFDELGERQNFQLSTSNVQRPKEESLVVGLLAGSRGSEARGNFPRMVEVAERIRAEFPGVKFLVPTTAATHPIVSRLVGEGFEVRQDAFDEMVPRCDLAITVSGTATLHVAIHGTPMIVVYHASPIVWHGLGRWLVKTRTYAQVNLLAADPQLASSGRVTKEMHVVPEFIPWFGSVDAVAHCAIDMLKNPLKLDAQRARLSELVGRLYRPGASMNTARMAMELLGSW